MNFKKIMAVVCSSSIFLNVCSNSAGALEKNTNSKKYQFQKIAAYTGATAGGLAVILMAGFLINKFVVKGKTGDGSNEELFSTNKTDDGKVRPTNISATHSERNSDLVEDLVKVDEYLKNYIVRNKAALDHQLSGQGYEIVMFRSLFDLYRDKKGTLEREKIKSALVSGGLDVTEVRGEIEKIKGIVHYRNIDNAKLEPVYIRRAFSGEIESKYRIALKEQFFKRRNIDVAPWRKEALTADDTSDDVMRRRVRKIFVDNTGNPMVITREDDAAEKAKYQPKDQSAPQTVEEYIFGKDKVLGNFSNRLASLDEGEYKAMGEHISRELLARELKFLEKCTDTELLCLVKLEVKFAPGGMCSQELLNIITRIAACIDGRQGADVNNADDFADSILSQYCSWLVFELGDLCFAESDLKHSNWDEEVKNFVRNLYANTFNVPFNVAAHQSGYDEIKEVISNKGTDILSRRFSFLDIFNKYREKYLYLDPDIQDCIYKSMAQQEIAYNDFKKIIENPVIKSVINKRFSNYTEKKADFTKSFEKRFDTFLATEIDSDDEVGATSINDLNSWRKGSKKLSLVNINELIINADTGVAHTIPELYIYGCGNIHNEFGSYWVSDILFPVYLSNKEIIKFV